MNPVAEEILMHYGIPRRSGRYPWGSGDNPYQHGRDFLGRIEQLKKEGWTETPENIKKEFGLTTGQYRIEKKLAKDERRMLDVARAKSLRDDGLGPTEIGRAMGINESTVRSLLNEQSEARMNKAKETADSLKARLKEVEANRGMLDVGSGVERELGISKEQLNASLYLLEREGYQIYNNRIQQATNPGQWTTQKILCPPGTKYAESYELERIYPVKEYTPGDAGVDVKKFTYPKSMDSDRLMIRYKDDVGPDGARGIDKDGIVEIRRGVDDLSLGNARYSQVRILVDGNKYIKGMAVYSDDMPDGVDVVFNTNKSKDVAKLDVLKDIKKDPDNPFGTLIKPEGQSTYLDADGKEQLSLINKCRNEGEWGEWKNALPSQFLAKQSKQMAKKQLDLAKADKLAEYEEICELTNPTVKKHLLEKFASNCDSAAVNLQAAALPGQKYHVIIPINSLKDNEVYAPGYETGTKLALIRYPHGGTFEIPILTVNNKNPLGKNLIGKESIDAVGINSKNAERLSGADFDGDTVMCIPTHDRAGKVKIISTLDRVNTPDSPLHELVGFDPKTAYPERAGMKYMKDPKTGKDSTQMEMGKISNLITDMTILGATEAELARAVKHSMVVIDAGKHKLDYKQSEIDNNIEGLKRDYQAHVDAKGNIRYGGASTILSRSKGDASVVKRQGTPKVNIKGEDWYDPTKPEGSLIYKTADDATYDVTRVNKRTGEVTTVTKTRYQRSSKMAETDDAYTLMSDTRHPIEVIYADYANSMKSLANQARKEMVSTGKIAYSSTAKSIYKAEVASLNAKLNTAELNKSRERAAQRMANTEVSAKKAADPTMKKSDIRKANQMAITKYRTEVGSIARSKRSIKITDREWEAIQAGAISENQLKKILNNTDIDDLRQRATPRATTAIGQAKINKIKSMSNSNYSLDEIARACGVSTTTVSNYLKGANA